MGGLEDKEANPLDEKVKHLELIQAVISRLAQNSFALRGWAVTLVAAIFALSAKGANQWYFLIALIPALTFWGLDAYYLRQERLFRKLYDTVRALDPEELLNNPFSMDTLPFTFPDFPETLADEEQQVESWLSTCWSKTIGWIYGPIAGTIILVTLIAFLCK